MVCDHRCEAHQHLVQLGFLCEGGEPQAGDGRGQDVCGWLQSPSLGRLQVPGNHHTLGQRKVSQVLTQFWHSYWYSVSFRKIIIEADNILQPLLTFEFSPKKTDMTRLSVSIVFQRRSLLFQLQLGMILRFIANQQFSQSLLVLQLIIHNNLV